MDGRTAKIPPGMQVNTSTGVMPAFLKFGREIKTKLPELRPDKSVINESTRDRDWSHKLTQKAYADGKRSAVPSPIVFRRSGAAKEHQEYWKTSAKL